MLIAESQMQRLQEESRVTGRSVGAIVRSAIDRHYSETAAMMARAEAARELLEWMELNPIEGTEIELSETFAALDAEYDEILARA